MDLVEEYAKKTVGKMDVENMKEKVMSLVENSEDEELEKIEIEDKKEKWDCESIISTYSNIYNHPAKIVEPKVPTILWKLT